MYRKKDRMGQSETKIVSLEDLVPSDHLLRKIDKAMSFDFIYEEVRGMYSDTEWGKPGIDPVVLFKIVFVQYLFLQQVMECELEEKLGYEKSERVSDNGEMDLSKNIARLTVTSMARGARLNCTFQTPQSCAILERKGADGCWTSNKN